MVKTSGNNTSWSFSAGDLNEKGINPKYYNGTKVTSGNNTSRRFSTGYLHKNGISPKYAKNSNNK